MGDDIMLFGNKKSDEVQNTDNLLQYDVGEVCKCYFTEIVKNVDCKISQQINKCQSYGRIVAKNPEETKEYTVVLFDSAHTIKKLPGRCLRKVKLEAYSYKDACENIGRVIESNPSDEERMITMIVTVVEDSDGDDAVMVNSMSVETMMDKFHYRDTGAPFCNIVMLKADEAFVGSSEED